MSWNQYSVRVVGLVEETIIQGIYTGQGMPPGLLRCTGPNTLGGRFEGGPVIWAPLRLALEGDNNPERRKPIQI